jgi:uncharacterized protein
MNISDYKRIIQDFLLPKKHYKTVLEIPLEALYKDGFRTILTDVDNTILPRSQKELSLQFANWVEKAKSIGFDFYLISNNSRYRRINKICKQVDVSGIHFACKPLTFSTRAFMKKHSLTPKETLFIGDQMLTDVIVGNWLKCTSILVDPFDNELSLIKAIQNNVEQVIKKWVKTL